MNLGMWIVGAVVLVVMAFVTDAMGVSTVVAGAIGSAVTLLSVDLYLRLKSRYSKG